MLYPNLCIDGIFSCIQWMHNNYRTILIVHTIRFTGFQDLKIGHNLSSNLISRDNMNESVRYIEAHRLLCRIMCVRLLGVAADAGHSAGGGGDIYFLSGSGDQGVQFSSALRHTIAMWVHSSSPTAITIISLISSLMLIINKQLTEIQCVCEIQCCVAVATQQRCHTLLCSIEEFESILY